MLKRSGLALLVLFLLALPASASAATSGKVHILGVDHSPDETYDVITGAINDSGTDKPVGRHAQKLMFSKGSFIIDTTALDKSFKFKRDKVGCSAKFSGRAKDAPISDGTGDYAGISGSLDLRLSGSAVGKVVGGKCKFPNKSAFLAVIEADGNVSF